MSTLTLESIFTFGKNKGKQVEDVIEDDPNYIAWLVEEDIVEFDDEIYELIEKRGIA